MDKISALQAEIEHLKDAYSSATECFLEQVAENKRLREKIKDIKEAWDWWQVDTHDRCASVVEDAIDAALQEQSK